MKLHEQIFFELKDNRIKYKNFSQLLSILSNKLDEKPENIAKCINRMLSDGTIIENSHRQLEPIENFGLRKGSVCGSSKGFAFIKPIVAGRQGFEIKKGMSQDCFVPASQLFGAFDGDIVLYRLEGQDSGAVVKILKRHNSEIVGKLVAGNNSIFKGKRLDSDNYYVIADNDRFSKPILISSKEIKNAKEGDIVVAQLTHQPEGNRSGLPVGRVKSVVEGADVEKCIISILNENQIPSVFPDKVLEDAKTLKTDFEEEKKKRVDLTNKLIVTIDGADAKDLDDAISIEKTSNGYVLDVHIADVGEYVKYDSQIDREAFIRGTSVYFPGRVYPMLPTELSNNLCSLNQNEEKLTLTVEMTLDNYGMIKSHRIYESIIKSSARLTHEQVFDIISKNTSVIDKNNSILSAHALKELLSKNKFTEISDKKIVDTILLMNELSIKVGKFREKAGALDLDLPETYFDMDGDKILDIRRRERNEAHKLIENFMVLANQTVAKTFYNLDIPFVYRIHGEPAKTRVNEVIDIINGFGVDIKATKKATPIYIQSILNEIKETEYSEVASKLILRALEKAIYSEECLGHFGLALDYYCHFTSPIRRYPDLTIHRIIKKACRACPDHILASEHMNINSIKNVFKNDYDLEEFVIDSAWQSSERERKSDEAERDADDLFKTKFMEDKIGNEYVGKISGVTNFGLFVELDNTVEGLIKIETLPADDYKYDEKKFVLKGRKRKFTIGQSVKVKIISTDLGTRRIGFLLLEN